MTHLDLFSGIGGFSLALERHGCRTVAFAEVEPFPRRVLAHRWPHVPNLGDVTALRGAEVRADIVTAGWPCQDLSVAGRRAGLAGARSGLFWQVVRIIREMQEAGHGPAFFVGENVPGLLSSESGDDFGSVLDALAELGALDVAWRVLDAQFFGVPQRRRRVFIVADLGGERAAEVLSLPEGVRRHPAASCEAREGVAGTLGGGSGDRTGSLTIGDGKPGQGVPAVAMTLNAKGGAGRSDWESGTFVVGTLSGEHGRNRGLGNANEWQSVVAFNWQERLNFRSSSSSSNPLKRNQTEAVGGPMGVRRLTPVECERLQGFPDGWTALPGAADGPRYCALGNSVAVPVVEWIAKRLVQAVSA